MTYCKRITRIQDRLKAVLEGKVFAPQKIGLCSMELDLILSELHQSDRIECNKRITRIQNRFKSIIDGKVFDPQKIRLCSMELDLLHSELHQLNRIEYARVVEHLKQFSLFQ